MAFWAYMLRCADGKYYTGHTDDLDRRMAEHQSGGLCGFTSRRRPVELVWSEWFQTRDDAFRAEFKVKGWSRAKKEGLITGDWNKVSFFARPPCERVSTSLDTSGVGNSTTSAQVEHSRDASGAGYCATSAHVERSRDISPGTVAASSRAQSRDAGPREPLE